MSSAADIPEECPYCAGDPRLPATRAGIGCHDPFSAYDLVTLRMQTRRPCADEVSSLVQAVRDHARTTRRLATVEAELKDAKERIRRVEAFAQNHAITSQACGRSAREWLDLLVIIEGGNPTSSGNSTQNYAGSSSARQSIGLPGHCERCAQVGHVAAHRNFGCGDVGCNVAHGPEGGA